MSDEFRPFILFDTKDYHIFNIFPSDVYTCDGRKLFTFGLNYLSNLTEYNAIRNSKTNASYV